MLFGPAALINGTPATLLPGGQYAVPSVFYFDRRRNVLIGEPGKVRGEKFPKNVVLNVKMEISNPRQKTFVLDGKAFDKKPVVGHILREVKHNLSRLNSTFTELEIDGELFEVEVPRAEFERITRELLQTMRMVDKLKSRCRTTIDYIVCVGGSSSMSQVRAAFAKSNSRTFKRRTHHEL